MIDNASEVQFLYYLLSAPARVNITGKATDKEHIFIVIQTKPKKHQYLPKGEFLSPRSIATAMKVLGILRLGT